MKYLIKVNGIPFSDLMDKQEADRIYARLMHCVKNITVEPAEEVHLEDDHTRHATGNQRDPERK